MNKRELFQTDIINIIENICLRKGVEATLIGNTQIFEEGLLDSIGFAEFMGTLEGDLGIDVPDHKLSTEFFLSPNIIVENFLDQYNSDLV